MKDAPLRILHLTAGSDAGGLSRYLLDLCTATVAHGHRVTLAGQRGAWHDRFIQAGWPWIDLPLKGGPISLWRSARRLRRALAGQSFDVIHAHYRRATLLGRRLQRAKSPPLLYTLHLSHLSLGGVNRWLSDFGDHVHAPSEDGKRWIVDDANYPESHVTVIPHGIDAARFPPSTLETKRDARASLGLKPGELVAAHVGRLDYPKNVDWLIELASLTRSSLPNLRIVLAGDGPEETALRDQARQLGVTHRVTFLGQCDPLPVYHAADLLLLPSLREGFSLACAEAMCAGIPVLRTRTSGTTELIVEGITGVSTAIDQSAFFDAAIALLSNPEALHPMGEAAAAHVRQHLTFDRQVGQTLALYHRLAERGGPPTTARPRRA